ncbi:MAG: type II secretion system protein GspM [Pseudomonadota bacterium]
MSGWWTSLNMRERGLIGLAIALTTGVLLWQAVLAPTLRTKANAQADLQEASQTLDQVLEGYSRKRFSGDLVSAPLPGQVILSADAFRGAVTRDAADKGLSISRLQGDDGRSFSLVFERVQPQQFFFWLQGVESNFGGRVTRLTVEQVGDGAVRVSVDLEQAIS